MRDRTRSLKLEGTNPFSSDCISIELGTIEEDNKPITQTLGDQDLEPFFEETKNIQSNLSELEQALTQLEYLHSKILTSVSSEDFYHHQLEVQNDNTTKLTTKINSQIRKLDSFSVDSRIISTQKALLSKSFKKLVLKFTTVQQNFKKAQERRFERQLKIVNPSITDIEIQEMMESSLEQQVFSQSILNDSASLLKSVKLRHTEILSLAKSIKELQYLFEDLSVLVNEQDDLVNQISYQINVAGTRMENAKVEMVKAVQFAKIARSRRWCLFWLVLIVLVGLALLIWLYVVPNFQKK